MTQQPTDNVDVDFYRSLQDNAVITWPQSVTPHSRRLGSRPRWMEWLVCNILPIQENIIVSSTILPNVTIARLDIAEMISVVDMHSRWASPSNTLISLHLLTISRCLLSCNRKSPRLEANKPRPKKNGTSSPARRLTPIAIISTCPLII